MWCVIMILYEKVFIEIILKKWRQKREDRLKENERAKSAQESKNAE